MTKGDGQIPSLREGVPQYLKKLSAEDLEIGQSVLVKFTRWLGQNLTFDRLAPPAVASYAEQLSPSDTDYQKKLEIIRGFLAFARKNGWSATNLGTHVKTRKSKGRTVRTPAGRSQGPVALSRERYEEMNDELVSLKDRSLQLVAEIQRAAADKDFRENAPLHAAREERGYVEGRIRELEEGLKNVVILDDNKSSSAKSTVGDCLILCDLQTGEDCKYVIVDPREVDALRGKISLASPLGKALLGKREGESVEIKAPRGTLRFKIKTIER
jgi:transcription elongation factor GreA